MTVTTFEVGQVPGDSKNNNITKEDEGDVNIFHIVSYFVKT